MAGVAGGAENGTSFKLAMKLKLIREGLQKPFGLYTAVNRFHIFNNQRQAVCMYVHACVWGGWVGERERSVCIYLVYKILDAAVCLGISV